MLRFVSWLVLLLPGTVLAAEAGAGFADRLLNVAAMLAVVLALIVALAFAARRLLPGAARPGRHIKVLEVLPLGKGERLCLVQVGEQTLLLGVGGSGVRCLQSWHEFPLATDQQAAAPAADFSAILARLVKSS